jgi:hypothetical protein
MTMTGNWLGVLLVLAVPGWAAAQEGATSARCKLDGTEVQVELRDSGDGLGSSTVHLVRKGSPELEVKFEEPAVRSLLAPGKLKGACDKTLAVYSGDTLLVALSEEGHPANPFLLLFTYSVSRHEISWKRRNRDQDRISPESQSKVALVGKEGFCQPTRLLGEADVGICNEDCGNTKGARIALISTGLPFDVYRCFQLSGGSAVATVDPERTWKGAWPELKRVFGTRENFERAFGFSGIEYAMTRALKANLSDGRICAYPTSGEKPPDDLEAWICPGGKKAKGP